MNKQTISYKIKDMTCVRTVDKQPTRIYVTLGDFEIETRHSEGGGGTFFFGQEYPNRDTVTFNLTPNAFSCLTGLDWDGTDDDLRRIRKGLERRVFQLDLGIRSNILTSAE